MELRIRVELEDVIEHNLIVLCFLNNLIDNHLMTCLLLDYLPWQRRLLVRMSGRFQIDFRCVAPEAVPLNGCAPARGGLRSGCDGVYVWGNLLRAA